VSPNKQFSAKPRVQNLVKPGSFFMPFESQSVLFYPDLYHKFLNKEQRVYYQAKDHNLLLKNLQVLVTTDLEECRRLWQEFSPQQGLFDTWEFRLAFYQGYHHQPYFLVFKTATENLALLPLWYEADKQKYFWFGSWWQEENKFFVKDDLLIPLLLAVCPRPVLLNAISDDVPAWVRRVIKFTADDPKYILDLVGLTDADDFLATFNKKRRYNFRRDRRIIISQRPQVIFDRLTDFKQLISLSKARFQQKGEETDWEDPRRVKTFAAVIRLGRQAQGFDIRMITVKIGAKVAAVDLIALCHGCYYPMKCGYNVKEFPGIGNYMNLLEINDAISLGAKKMDFLEIGYGWKDRWFTAVPLLKFARRRYHL